MSDDAPPLVGQLADRYEFLEELGRGGTSVVYLARERAGQRRVAIKLVSARYAADSEAVRRFAREARTAASLRHPNIVRTLAIEEVGGAAVAIVNDYVPGETLRAALRATGPFPVERASAVLRDVAAALAYAHAHRVVHRDVKPENVFLEAGTGRALLADFGIARTLDRGGDGDTLLTVEGTAVGTPTYMSPEQVDGRPVDERTDVYALGLVGWELLSGRRPWQGDSLYAVLHKQKHAQLPDLTELRPDTPVYLLNAITGALAKSPEARWRDAAAFLERLTPTPASLPDAPDADPLADHAEGATVQFLRVPDQAGAPSEGSAAGGSAGGGSAADDAPDGTPAVRQAPAPRRGRQRWPLIATVAAGAAAFAVLIPWARGTGRSANVRVDPELEWLLTATAAVTAALPQSDSARAAAAPYVSADGGDVGAVGRRGATVDTPPRRTTAPPTPAPPAAVPPALSRPVPPAPRPERQPSVPVPSARTVSTARAVPTGASPPPRVGGASLPAVCRSPASADQRTCLMAQIERDDAVLTRDYQALIAQLRRIAGDRGEPQAVRALRAEQRAWLVQRDNACRTRTRATEGGLWGVARAPCFAEWAERRAAELRGRTARLGDGGGPA